MHQQLHEQLIRDAFSKAADLIKQSNTISKNFIEREIKLSIDVELDSFFKTYLEQNTPYPVYSEESHGNQLPLSGRQWIVDPLDGSLNFSRGIPFYASSIALWENGSPLLGGIYDYVHGDFFWGVIGQGAFLNGKEIKTNNDKNLSEIKATGIPSYSNIQTSLDMFASSLTEYKKLRWLGCASLSLAYVACGRIDCYQELGIKIWDIAAGVAIVLASGGKIESSYNADGSMNLQARRTN